jgi:hypothetical protein
VGESAPARCQDQRGRLAGEYRRDARGSVNIQGTFREHSGNIQGAFSEHSVNVLDCAVAGLRDVVSMMGVGVGDKSQDGGGDASGKDLGDVKRFLNRYHSRPPSRQNTLRVYLRSNLLDSILICCIHICVLCCIMLYYVVLCCIIFIMFIFSLFCS